MGRKSAVGARHIVAPQQSGRAVSNYNYSLDALVNTGMKAAESVYGCMHFLGKSVGEPPLVVMDDGEPDHDHELSRLFARPCDHFSQSMLWYLHVTRKKASEKGASLFCPLDSRGMPAEVWSKSSDEVRIVPSDETFIGHFEERVQGAWVTVPDDTLVIWDRYPDPANTWGSLAPLTVAQRSVRSLRTMADWIDNILQNMGVVGLLVSAEGYIEDAAFNRIKRIIEEEWAGSLNGGSPRFLDNGANCLAQLWSNLGYNDQDTDEAYPDLIPCNAVYYRCLMNLVRLRMLAIDVSASGELGIESISYKGASAFEDRNVPDDPNNSTYGVAFLLNSNAWNVVYASGIRNQWTQPTVLQGDTAISWDKKTQMTFAYDDLSRLGVHYGIIPTPTTS